MERVGQRKGLLEVGRRGERHAICGNSGSSVIGFVIVARLCGSSNGARGTSASNSASNSGVNQAAREHRPPWTTR